MEEFCYWCWNQTRTEHRATYVIVMGCLEMAIEAHGYCVKHMGDIVHAYNRGNLCCPHEGHYIQEILVEYIG